MEYIYIVMREHSSPGVFDFRAFDTEIKALDYIASFSLEMDPDLKLETAGGESSQDFYVNNHINARLWKLRIH